MRRVPLSVLLSILFLSAAFAGCASSDDEEPSDIVVGDPSATAPGPVAGDVSADPEVSGAPDPSGAPEPDANNLPVATLTADVTEGVAPVDIVFTVSAEDADGDGLAWSLDVDSDGSPESEGDGAGLPLDYTHSFTEAGDYTATLTVSDGVDEAVSTVELAIAAAAAEEGIPPVVITGTAIAPTVTGLLLQCVRMGVDGDLHDIAPATEGWTYLLEPSDGSFLMWWYAAGSYVDAADPEGTVPAGVDQVEICSGGAVAGDYTLTLNAP